MPERRSVFTVLEVSVLASLAKATRNAFRSLVDHAASDRVDFVVIAGDVFDGGPADYATGLFFLNGLVDLGRAGVPVVMIHGNHDASSKMTRSLTWPGHVRVLGFRAPETHVLDHVGVSIHGQSFADGAVPGNTAPCQATSRRAGRGYPGSWCTDA